MDLKEAKAKLNELIPVLSPEHAEALIYLIKSNDLILDVVSNIQHQTSLLQEFSVAGPANESQPTPKPAPTVVAIRSNETSNVVQLKDSYPRLMLRLQLLEAEKEGGTVLAKARRDAMKQLGFKEQRQLTMFLNHAKGKYRDRFVKDLLATCGTKSAEHRMLARLERLDKQIPSRG